MFISVPGPYLADGKNNDSVILKSIIQSNIDEVKKRLENEIFSGRRGFET